MTIPLRAGDRAPNFTLPAADCDSIVALADYRGTPVLLMLLRGLYCPFCRRQIAQFQPTAERLRALGVETLGVVATAADRARLYFQLTPAGFPLGADPALATHRAYGLGVIERNDKAADMVERAAQRVALELGLVPAGEARAVPTPRSASATRFRWSASS